MNATRFVVISAGRRRQAQDDEDAHHAIDQIVVTATPLGRTVEELAQPTTILRGEELMLPPPVNVPLQAGDVLVVAGTAGSLRKLGPKVDQI